MGWNFDFAPYGVRSRASWGKIWCYRWQDFVLHVVRVRTPYGWIVLPQCRSFVCIAAIDLSELNMLACREPCVCIRRYYECIVVSDIPQRRAAAVQTLRLLLLRTQSYQRFPRLSQEHVLIIALRVSPTARILAMYLFNSRPSRFIPFHLFSFLRL